SLIPKIFRPLMSRLQDGWGKFFVVPIETGRGCPYGCEFCTVTGFFGDSIRFRTNESVVEELLRLKERARREKGKIAVFFIDDNLAINKKRLKSLLHDIIAADAQLPFCSQISANLLGDEELIDLLKEAGARWVFIGMESIDPTNMADVNKTFSRPENYPAVLESLQRRNIYAVTSFIFGMDNDTEGVATRTVDQIEEWAPGLPVFGMLTPFPGTPLYTRLKDSGRLRREKHWLRWTPYMMAHDPIKMSSDEAQIETRLAWERSYSPERNLEVVESLSGKPTHVRLIHLIMRLFFRGIYFPQIGKWAWIKLIASNRSAFMAIRSKREPISPQQSAVSTQ
ncbi:MAG: B12-binding domain-containing radical SAM protein, partial [Pyrinomonadaceae bacterium]